MSSCTDEWDNHYNKQAAVINNEEMTIVDAPAIEYLESQQSYSSICNLFKETGIFKEMEAAGVSYTLFVVDNTLMTTVRSLPFSKYNRRWSTPDDVERKICDD